MSFGICEASGLPDLEGDDFQLMPVDSEDEQELFPEHIVLDSRLPLWTAGARLGIGEADLGKCVIRPCSQLSTISTNTTIWNDDRSPAESTGIDSEDLGRRHCDPSQTVIFFDWDDTLFPTSELHGWTQSPSSTEEAELKDYGSAVHEYLSLACTLSEGVVIVTNSVRPWVETCIDKFVPGLQKFLDQGELRVVYAREVGRIWCRERNLNPVIHRAPRADNEVSQEFTAMKRKAMEREVKAFYRQRGQPWTNILSFGDAPFERDALQDLAFRRVSPPGERLRVKTVLLNTAPSITSMTLRLRLETQLLPAYVQFDGSIDLDLQETGKPMGSIAQALRMPQLMSVDFPLHAWGLGAAPGGAAGECFGRALCMVEEAVQGALDGRL
mmetsp:Transcript_97787/g.276773  ORF Transcript_97787/g.276773 Transcript_97787/m.276773 type:complete len:384 (+) Transcript_97787:85-1236(+)